MRFLVGSTALDGKDYQQALEPFTGAGNLVPFSKIPELEIISLVCRLFECMFRYSQRSLDIWVEFRLVATHHP